MFDTNGMIDPNWIIAFLLGVVGFFLIRILNRIEKKLEVQDKRISVHDTEIAVIKTELKR